MLTPVQQASLSFTSDGTSTALIVDLSTAPVGIDWRGQSLMSILKPLVVFTGGTLTPTATVEGTIATFTFQTAPAQLDGSANLIVYALSFLVQFGGG